MTAGERGPVSQPGVPPLLAEGVSLFNAGRYFEAHEVLEDGWRAAAAGDRDVYQGLLQVGVGLLHAARGNRKGSIALLDRGIDRLTRCAPGQLGLDTGRLLADARALRAEISRGDAGAFHPVPALIARLGACPGT